MRVFFATDIHGSEVCWRKFVNAAAFYKADVVVLGGDVTGKVMIPIIEHPGYWETVVSGMPHRLETEAELAELEKNIRNRGFYPVRVSPDELSALGQSEESVEKRFEQEMVHTLERWLDMADSKLRGGEIPCIINGGNDDTLEIDPILESSPVCRFGEGRVLELDGFYIASVGYTNPTPWATFREAPEDELAMRIKLVVDQIPDMERAIFNFHAPPYGTGLDEAPALDENLRPIRGGAVMKPVGSTAVRDAIREHQPMLSIHGHIHESRGVKKIGRTLALNPGSVYSDGVLQGALLELNPKKAKVAKYLFVNG